jgi:hypothetical protein
VNADQMAPLQEAAADFIFANADVFHVQDAVALQRMFSVGASGEPMVPGNLNDRRDRALTYAYRAGADLRRKMASHENIGRVIAWEHYGIKWEHLERQSRADILDMVAKMLASTSAPRCN